MATNAPAQARLADQSIADQGASGYTANYVYKLAAGHTVRVRIHRDSYARQSFARVEVLTPALTWTELATAPVDEWHEVMPARYATRRAEALEFLAEMALVLVDRASDILA